MLNIILGCLSVLHFSPITFRNEIFSQIQQVRTDGDTIYVVDCSESAYHPLSNAETRAKLVRRIMKNSSNFLKINLDSTRMASETDTISLRNDWCFELECGTTSSNILSENIKTKSVELFNGIMIGMRKTKFFRAALGMDLKPENVVIIESCVDDLQQCFVFKNDELTKIQIHSPGIK